MSSVENVSVGKPKITGAVYRAPAGSTLPTDATTELDIAFKELGYVSEDGVENEDKRSSEKVKDWGGNIIASIQNGKEDAYKMSLVEALNVEVLKTVYGDANVTGSLETGIVIKSNGDEQEPSSWVIDMIMHGSFMKRIVIPNGKLSNLETIKYKSNDLISYGITIDALPDSTGTTHYEYIAKKTA